MEGKGNDLGTLNDLLFQELERLQAVDASDETATKTEIERARAIQGIASQITTSSKIVLDTVRLRAEWAGSKYATTPKMLNG